VPGDNLTLLALSEGQSRPDSQVKTLFNFITIIFLSINTVGRPALYEIIIIFYFLSRNLMFVISWRNSALPYSLWVTGLGGLSLGRAALRQLKVESDLYIYPNRRDAS
jgi:hypothetical protein